MKRLFTALIVACVLALMTAAGGAAAPNPSGTGQPSVECGDPGATSAPHGFSTGGFATAETQYAGSGVSADRAQSSHAVSQYDVACYQQTQNGH